MEIKVEENIPLPPSATMKGSSKYPFKKLEIGDSFFIPVKEGKAIESLQRSIISTNQTGIKITTRTIAENGVRGIRTWRVK